MRLVGYLKRNWVNLRVENFATRHIYVFFTVYIHYTSNSMNHKFIIL